MVLLPEDVEVVDGETGEKRVGVYDITTLQYQDEIEAVTAAIAWVVEQQKSNCLHCAVMVTNSQSMLRNINKDMFRMK